MAGDWIQVEYATPNKPEMLAAASRLGIDPDIAFAAWFRIWCWADANLPESGHAANVTMSHLDRVGGVTGIAQAFAEEGWICAQNDGLQFVNFARHNGKSAKARLLASERKRNSRRKASRSHRDKSVTREEKRREEKSKKKKPLIPLFDSVTFPPGMDTPEVRQAITDWLDHHRSIGKPYKKPAQQIGLLLKRFGTPQEFVTAVEYSRSNNYQGCVSPGGQKDANPSQPIRRSGRVHQRTHEWEQLAKKGDSNSPG